MAGVMSPGRRGGTGALDLLQAGLSAASTIYGMKQAGEQADRLREELEVKKATEAREAQARADYHAGVRSKGELADLASKGTHVSDRPFDGSQPVYEKAGGPVVAYVGKSKADSPLKSSLAKVKGPGGGPVYQWVKEGEQVDAYQEPTAPKEDKTPGNTADLRKEYNGHPTTKRTAGVLEQYNRIGAIASNKAPTGASDIALVFAYMKMNDPDSAVREGEYATAANAGAVDDKLIGVYNSLLKGEKLPPEVRANFVAEADRLLAGQLKSQESVDRWYTDIASQFKLDPKYVIDSNFGSQMASVGKGQQKDLPSGEGVAFAAPGQRAEPSPEDKKAMEYAYKNPQDPLSKQILQRLKERGVIADDGPADIPQAGGKR